MLIKGFTKQDKLWLIENEKDLKKIFTGKAVIPNTNQSVHRGIEQQREGLLCCLYNLVFEMDLRMSIDDICTFIAIYGNNIRTFIEKKRFMSKRKHDLNKNEQKLVSHFLDIMLNKYRNILKIEDKMEQFLNLKEIRKWASMTYSVILNGSLPGRIKNFKIKAYVDEISFTRIVLVDEDEPRKDFSVTWLDIKFKDLSAKLEEIKKSFNNNKKINSEEAKYQSYYEEALECMELGKYSKAEKLLNKIINCKEVFHFTSGAYVSLATVKLNNSKSINRKKIESLLEKALEIKPQNKVAPVVYVNLYIMLKDFKKARYWLKRCNDEESIEVLEQNLEEMHDIFNIILLPGQAPEFLNNDDALAFFEDALELIPDNLFIRLTVAKLYANREEEYLLKAYDIYKSLIDDIPDFYYPYQLIGDLCGAGYFKRYKEQEEYYLKALELLEKSNVTIDKDIETDKEIRFVIEGNLISCYLNLGKYKKVLKLTEKRIKENPNNTDLHNRAAALYFLERYRESIAFCHRELFVGEDESTYILLGKNFYALEEFDEAITALRKAMAFIDQGELFIQYKDENEKTLLSYTKQSWQDNKLKEVYTLLIASYYRQGDYLSAKAIWKLANEKFKKDTNIEMWGHTIDAMIETKKQLEKVNIQFEQIKGELKREREEAKARENVVRQWALQLMKIQRKEPIDEIDIEYWEMFEKEIDNIIAKMQKEVDDKKGYAELKKSLSERYPKLTSKSKRFLSTAEYLYRHNRDNFIDFAPIVVEFCKVVETELRVILKQEDLTLGQAIYLIELYNISPLVNELQRLDELYKCRNGSAHTGESTREKVELIRKILLGERGLLDILSQMK